MAAIGTGADEPLFEPQGTTLLVRTPLLPVEIAQRWFNGSAPLRAADGPFDHSLIERLFETEPCIQEAILIASPDLVGALSRHGGKRPLKRQRATSSLARYMVRMATRPTPFGLCAGVALASLGNRMDISLAPWRKNRKRARPDMGWLMQFVLDLEQRPEIASHLTFYANPSAWRYGERFYLPYVDSVKRSDAGTGASFRATAVVTKIMELAQSGVSLSDLVRIVEAEWPDAAEDQIVAVLDGLRHQNALISDPRPPLTSTDPFGYVQRRMRDIPSAATIADGLAALSVGLASYNSQPVGEGFLSYQRLTGMASEMFSSKGYRSIIEVDMLRSVDRMILSPGVAKEAGRAAELLLRLSTAPIRFRHLDAYRREFVERYGSAREVRLLELLDEHAGLGPPTGYQRPPRSRQEWARPRSETSGRDRILHHLVLDAVRTGHREVILDEETLRRIEQHPDWKKNLPSSVDLFFSVASPSLDALNSGDFQVIVGPIAGNQFAGRTFGRFCDLLGDQAAEVLRRAAHEEETANPGRLFAEMVFLPDPAILANVMIHPATRRYEIAVGVTPGVARDDSIPLNDLVIGLMGDRFYVKSMSRGREVVVRSTHRLNYSYAHNVYRFLAEVSEEGALSLQPFDWGVAGQATFLPRLRVGRVVLSPATWQLTLAPIDGRDLGESSEWAEAVGEWRSRWSVPRYVYHQPPQSDNRLLLDLENRDCLAYLKREWLRNSLNDQQLTLKEMWPDFEHVWAQDEHGEHFLTEFVIPLHRLGGELPDDKDARNDFASRSVSTELEERLRLPGSDWLFLKAFSGENHHDSLVGDQLGEACSALVRDGQINGWFFVRYADPDPHVRLRLHGEPTRIMTHVLPWLSQLLQRLVHLGVIRKVTFDSYDREVERYGGKRGMTLAEEIFCADSIAVAAILRMRRQMVLARGELALLTVDDLMTALGLSPAQRLLLYSSLRAHQERFHHRQLSQLRKAFHDRRKEAETIVLDRAWLRSQPGGGFIDDFLCDRAGVLGDRGQELVELERRGDLAVDLMGFPGSCIHMHINRLLGMDPDMEFEILFSLEIVLQSVVLRAR